MATRRSPRGSLPAARGRASRRPARGAGGRVEQRAPRGCVGGAARTPPTWRPRRRDRRAPAGPPAVLRRSASRRPRVAADLLDQAAQDVVVHRELADLALRLGEPTVLDRRRATLQALTAGGEEVLTPAADRAYRLAGLPRQRVQALAAQQPHDHLLLAPRAPAHLVG